MGTGLQRPLGCSLERRTRGPGASRSGARVRRRDRSSRDRDHGLAAPRAVLPGPRPSSGRTSSGSFSRRSPSATGSAAGPPTGDRGRPYSAPSSSPPRSASPRFLRGEAVPRSHRRGTGQRIRRCRHRELSRRPVALRASRGLVGHGVALRHSSCGLVHRDGGAVSGVSMRSRRRVRSSVRSCLRSSSSRR